MPHEIVSSPQNPRLKLVRKLGTRRGREREGAFAVEGEDLVLAGLDAARTPRYVLCDADEPPSRDFLARLEDVPCVLVPGVLLAQVAELAHPPRAIGVFDLPADRHGGGLDGTDAGAVLYLDGLRDPGNVGTSIRAAMAFGVGVVALGQGTADPWSPKASRASMGAIFGVRCSTAPDVGSLAPDTRVVVLDVDGDVDLHEAELGTTPVLVVGSERDGVSAAARERADLAVRIPQQTDIDSLNAAMAAAIVLYEWRRQVLTTDIAPNQ